MEGCGIQRAHSEDSSPFLSHREEQVGRPFPEIRIPFINGRNHFTKDRYTRTETKGKRKRKRSSQRPVKKSLKIGWPRLDSERSGRNRFTTPICQRAAIIPRRRKVTRRVTAYGLARRNAHARAHCHRRLCIMPFRGGYDDDDDGGGGGEKECASIGRRA